MTLGDIINEYCKEHSKADFIRDSGLSRNYTYMLIKGTNSTSGAPIKPSIDTIKKAAKGMHTSFDEIFNKLDDDMIIHIEGTPSTSKITMPNDVAELFNQLTQESKEAVYQKVRDEYEKNKDLITEYQRVINLDKITSIEDARILLDNTAAFGGVVGDEQLIELANVIRSNHN